MCEVMDFANKLDKMIGKIPSELNRWQQIYKVCNDKCDDLNHLLENRDGELNAWQLTKVSKKLGQIRVERREAKFKLDKWKHLKGCFYDKHNSSQVHINSAKEFIKKEDVSQRMKLKDKKSSYMPRHYKNLFDDDIWEKL